MNDDVGLKLTGTRILVRPPRAEKTSAGGIIIPYAVREREERAHTTGVLIAAAEDAWKCKEMRDVKLGDNLFHARYAGDNIPFTKNGVVYKVLNAPDVVGILSEMPDDPFRPALTQKETGQISDMGVPA